MFVGLVYFYMRLVLGLFYARCLITGLFCLFYICLSVLAILLLKLSAIETLLFFEGFLLLFSFCLIICVGLKPARVYYYIKNYAHIYTRVGYRERKELRNLYGR